jgi:hypothetical protein
MNRVTPFAPKTAILLFARTSQAEMQHKWLPKGDLVYKQFNGHSLKLIKHSGLPYFHFSEKEQCGNNFGEKFTNAIQRIFDLGFDRIISIGNDTPHLTKLEIRKAIESIEVGNQVLGPSRDGGIYLLGLLKSEFDKEHFLTFSWGRSCLYQELKKYFEISGEKTLILPAFVDVDTIYDVSILLRFTSFIPFGIIKLFQALISREKILRFELALGEITPFYTPNSNKGSPLYSPVLA